LSEKNKTKGMRVYLQNGTFPPTARQTLEPKYRDIEQKMGILLEEKWTV